MKTLLFFFAFCLCSCGPLIDTQHGIVSGGFLSSTQGFSGSMVAANGVKVTWSMVGVDAATGPTNLANAVATGVIGVHTVDGIVKTNASNNAASVSKNASKNKLAGQQAALKAPATSSTTVTGPKGGTKTVTTSTPTLP